MILVTEAFEKLVSKVKSMSMTDVSNEIHKHAEWLNNFKTVWIIKNRKILKGYLLSKKVRLVVLYQEKNGNYLPFYIAKKETKDGWNISKYSLDDLSGKLNHILEDLEKWRFYKL